MEKVTVSSHGAVEVTVVDFSGCKPGTFAAVIEEAERTICKQPKGLVRVVTVFEGVSFDMGTVKEMQKYASAVMPHLQRCGLVGIDRLKKVVFIGIRPLFTVPVELFEDVAAARAWAARG